MINNAEDLQATAQAFYDAIREAMIEHQAKPFDNRNKLNKSWQLAARIAKLNGVKVENLPFPKSIVASAPQITTPEALKQKAQQAPPPPVGDVLADNAPATKRTRARKI